MAGNDHKVFTELFIGHSTSTIEVDLAPSPTLTTGVDSAPSPTPTAEVDSVPSPTPTAEVNSAPGQVSKTVVDSVSGPVSNTVVDSASGLASEIVVDSVTSPASKKAVDSASGHHPALKTVVNPTPRPAPKTAVDSEAAQKTGLDEVDPIWGMWGQEPWACEAQYNSQLENATEFDKAGSSSASTIMALLPALLAFAPIVTAKIGLLRNLSLSHGFIAAAFTFGLPVQQLEIMTTRSVTSVKRLLGNVEDDLSRCGTAGDSIPSANQSVSPMPQPFNNCAATNQPPAITNLNSQDANEAIEPEASSIPNNDLDEEVCTQQVVDLSTCHDNNSMTFSDVVEDALAPIKQTVFDSKRPSRIWVQLLMYIFSVIHLSLAWCLVVIILFVDPSNIIWLCPGAGGLTVSIWLVGVFSIVGFMRVRFESKIFAATEVIYISKASKTMGTGYWKRIWYPQPMVVILRPTPDITSDSDSSGIKSLRVIHLLGILQLCWILFLSFFFSSTIGGALFRTLLTVSAFIFVVAVSRGLSILTHWLAEKYIGLKVIEYDNLQELRVIRNLLGALSEVLIEIRDCAGSWMSSEDAQWRECITSYLWGQREGHEGHGNSVQGATQASQVCAIRDHKLGTQGFMDEAIPMVGAVFTVCFGLGPPLKYLLHFDTMGSGELEVIVILLLPVLAIGFFSLLSRGRRWLVLCNCRIDTS